MQLPFTMSYSFVNAAHILWEGGSLYTIYNLIMWNRNYMQSCFSHVQSFLHLGFIKYCSERLVVEAAGLCYNDWILLVKMHRCVIIWEGKILLANFRVQIRQTCTESNNIDVLWFSPLTGEIINFHLVYKTLILLKNSWESELYVLYFQVEMTRW